MTMMATRKQPSALCRDQNLTLHHHTPTTRSVGSQKCFDRSINEVNNRSGVRGALVTHKF